MSKCLWCGGRDVSAILTRELIQGEQQITFRVLVCRKCYLNWIEERKKEGFK